MAKVTLKAARISAGFTRKALAERMGISDDTVARWETGKTSIKPAYLYMLCGITGFTEGDIFLPEEYSKSVPKNAKGV